MKKGKLVAYLFIAAIVLWFAGSMFQAASKIEVKSGDRAAAIEEALKR